MKYPNTLKKYLTLERDDLIPLKYIAKVEDKFEININVILPNEKDSVMSKMRYCVNKTIDVQLKDSHYSLVKSEQKNAFVCNRPFLFYYKELDVYYTYNEKQGFVEMNIAELRKLHFRFNLKKSKFITQDEMKEEYEMFIYDIDDIKKNQKVH